MVTIEEYQKESAEVCLFLDILSKLTNVKSNKERQNNRFSPSYLTII